MSNNKNRDLKESVLERISRPALKAIGRLKAAVRDFLIKVNPGP